MPLHVCDLTRVPWQTGLPQTVPEAQSAQAPAPLQTPVSAQVDAADRVHWLPGFVPAAALPQMPSAPPPFSAAVHAWQTPLQAVLQHTPSTQKPDWHCDAEAQALPLPSTAAQTPAVQVSPGMQSALVAHEVLQAPAEQT